MQRMNPPATRIASLLASATEILYALGLGDRLVGISHECDYPPEALDRPRLSRARFDPTHLDSGAIDAAVRRAMAEHGSVYEVDAERLAALAPDLILTQAVCDVCAVPTTTAQQAVAALDYEPVILSLDAHDLAGIFRTVLEVGRAAGVAERAERLVAGLRARIDAVRRRSVPPLRDAERGTGGEVRVLALEWLDPPFVPGHWVPEMIAAAGGLDLFGRAGRRSRQMDWSELADAEPEVLLVMPCGFGLAASRGDADRHADRLRAVAGTAIAAGRAWVLDGSSYFNRSGPRVADGIEILGAVLYPEAFPEIPLTGRAARWP